MNADSASFGTRGPKRWLHAKTLLLLSALSTVLVAGCDAEQASRNRRTKYLNDQSPAGSDASAATPRLGSPAAPSPKEKTKTTESAQTPDKPLKRSRKIIYDARIDLVVDSIAATDQAISGLIKEYEGFLAESDHSSVSQNHGLASWRVRVPVAHFEAFASAVARLGEVRQNHVGSQDVTEEYVDIEARIRNKREEEKRLLKHLADSTGKLEDILAVEKELSRVRGEAEQMEGRLRFLADRADLSTVTIEASEWKDYKPPVAATFQTRVGRTFFLSVETLFEFGKALALLMVLRWPRGYR